MSEENENKKPEKENAQLQDVLNRIAEELVSWVQYRHTGAITISINFDKGQVDGNAFDIKTGRIVPAQKPYLKKES